MSASGNNPLAELRARISAELRGAVRPGVLWLADQIYADYGESALGVLFYGSCLRKESDAGILDFWVVVDDYTSAYTSAYAGGGLKNRCRAVINQIAAPNVFYLERAYQGETLRTKFGVIDRKAFERGTARSAAHPYIWARFAQPARLLACRDDEARTFLINAISEAILTMVGRLVCFLPGRARHFRFSTAAFWQQAFRRTYDSERRPEAEERIRELYLANDERYDVVASLAVQILAERGHFDSATQHPRAIEVGLSRTKQAQQRFRWHLMRPYARALGLLRLFKTAWTFGDWVPYALWKLERHTGRRIEISERQRRHPLVFGWPIILPLLFKRNLR